MKKDEGVKKIQEVVDRYEELIARHDSWYGEATPDYEAYLSWVEDLGEEVSKEQLEDILASIDARYNYSLKLREGYWY